MAEDNSKNMGRDAGRRISENIAVGIDEGSYKALTAMENVYVELENVSKRADVNARNLAKKRRKRELDNLKNALELELITEREYYEKLRDYRDKNLRQGSDDWYRYTEEILKYNKRMADRVVESQREMLERVQELQGELAQKLKTDNAPWFEATKTVIRGIGDFGRNAVYYNNKLSDFQSEIEMLTGYRDAILALKELGNIPEGVFDDISHMSVEEGLASARAILTAGEEARSRFVLGYNRRSELAGSISAELNPILNREALEEAGIYSAEAFNSAYFKKDEEEKTEFVRLLEQSFESVPDSYYKLGTSAAESFAEGFTASIPDIMAEIRSSMTEAMNSLVNELASTLESRVKAENSGKSTTFNNTYTFNASKDTTTQQLAAAKNSATLERLRGGY